MDSIAQGNLRPGPAGPASTRRTSLSEAETSILDLPLSDCFWLLCLNLLILQHVTGFGKALKYFDEVVAVLLLVAAVAKALKKKAEKAGPRQTLFLPALLLALLVAIGLYGNFVGGIGARPSAIAIDIVACTKTMLALFAGSTLLEGRQGLFRAAETESKLLMAIMVPFAIANLFFDIGMGVDPRYGLRASFLFIFAHPTYLTSISAGFAIILFKHKEENVFWLLLAALLSASTLRAKGIALAAVIILILMTVRTGGRFTSLHALAGALLAAYIGYDQVIAHYRYSGTARGELMRASLKVARDHFPIGTGFATFASNVTANPIDYSPLYYEYGISTVRGLEPGGSWISDTFWPIILGQFGIVGLIVFLALLASLYFLLCKQHPNDRISIVVFFGSLLISSTAETAFFHPLAMIVVLCLCITFWSEPRACEGSSAGDAGSAKDR